MWTWGLDWKGRCVCVWMGRKVEGWKKMEPQLIQPDGCGWDFVNRNAADGIFPLETQFRPSAVR